jgi:hypothetical protein
MLIPCENVSISPGVPPQADLQKSTTSYGDSSFSSALLQKTLDHPKLCLKLSFCAAC